MLNHWSASRKQRKKRNRMALPIDVWGEVWRFLSPGDSCALRFVCKDWRERTDSSTPSPIAFMWHIRLLRTFHILSTKTEQDVSGRFRASGHNFSVWIQCRYATNQWTIWRTPEDFRHDKDLLKDGLALRPRGKPPPHKEWCHGCGMFVIMEGPHGHIAMEEAGLLD